MTEESDCLVENIFFNHVFLNSVDELLQQINFEMFSLWVNCATCVNGVREFTCSFIPHQKLE